MAKNPDVQGKDELVPFLGMLRWLDHGPDKILQQFQYSGSMNANDWYDVPEVDADTIEDKQDKVAEVPPGDMTATEVEARKAEYFRTPAQTEETMLAAAKNAPVRVDRTPPYSPE